MSKLVCKKCKSIAVEYEDYCGGTSYYRCKTCGMRGNEDKFTQVNIFHRITASPEVLAESLVFWEGGWTSRFIRFTTTNQEEAVAATVAKLKEFEE